MAYIPEEVLTYLEDNPEVSGAELARLLRIPGRSARRYVMNYRSNGTKNLPVRSQQIEEWEATREEDDFDADAFLDEAPKLVRQAQAKDPVFTNDHMTFPTNKPVGIMWVSCMHLGGRYTAYEEFRDVYEEALSIPHLYWGSLGDDIEGFISQFPDADAVQSQILSVERQMLLLEKVLDPMVSRRKLLFGCGSQHGGKWIQRRQGRNPVKEMYLNMRVPFFDGQAYVQFDVGDETYFVGLAHEMPGSSQTNPNHAQARALRDRYPNADVVVMGDRHTPSMQWHAVYRDEYEAGNRPSPYVWLLAAGTAKTGPDKYTINGWPKGTLGWPITVFFPDEHKVKCTFDLEDARQWLKG